MSRILDGFFRPVNRDELQQCALAQTSGLVHPERHTYNEINNRIVASVLGHGAAGVPGWRDNNLEHRGLRQDASVAENANDV